MTSAAAAWAVLAGVVAPGLAVVHLARLGCGPLERVVLAVACGRLLLALVTLLAAAAGVAHWLPAWGVVGALAAIGVALRARRARGAGGAAARLEGALALVLVAVAAFALVYAVVGRSGLPTPAGDLVFYGRDATNDPLVYAATAVRVLESGLPTDAPWLAGLPLIGHRLFLGELAGLLGVAPLDLLDATFRVRPLLDVGSLGLGTYALARALGATAFGATAGALLLLLGGDVSQHVYAVAAALGLPTRQLEIWGLGTGFLLPVNPIAPALQTVFAALLLLARAEPQGAAGLASPRARGVAAGLLVAAVFELKLFLWPPFAAGLAAAALLGAPPPCGRALRAAAAVAWLAALPALVSTLALGRSIAGRIESGLSPCLGCLPAWVIDRSFGGGERDWFGRASWHDLLDPGAWALALGAMALWTAIHLGARALAVPALWRALRGRGEAGSRAALRAIGAAAAAGLALACATATRPYPLNAGQFAWAASFGLWPVLGLALGRAAARGRRLALAAVGLLALPGGVFWIAGPGWLAPVHQTVSLEERILLETLRDASPPDDLVLEPSLLMGGGRLSPVPWLARRPVYASLGAMTDYLAPAERARRRRVVAQAFESRDPAAAMAAIRESGARWVYAPAERPLSVAPGGELEPIRANPAGAIYRVRPVTPRRS